MEVCSSARATQSRVFQESLTWARDQASKIKNQIADVDKSPSQERSPVCRPTLGKLPCARKPKTQADAKESTPSLSQGEALQGKILVFISLSMPEASLKSLVQEAERFQAVLVLRGLVNDSFKETAEIIQRFGLFAEINPEAFERYHIQYVPTFVWVDENDQEQARLSGNVTLSFAQKRLRRTL